ncbi:type II toxin-antitoxin system RelB/DinJ family antitoxin [Breznakiellaceae bacterium SP9]
MSDTINVTIRLDKDVKERAESMFNGLGMNLSTAVNVFIHQTLRQGKLPFEVSDPFYQEENLTKTAGYEEAQEQKKIFMEFITAWEKIDEPLTEEFDTAMSAGMQFQKPDAV